MKLTESTETKLWIYSKLVNRLTIKNILKTTEKTVKLFGMAFIKLYIQRNRKITFAIFTTSEWANYHRQTQHS